MVYFPFVFFIRKLRGGFLKVRTLPFCAELLLAALSAAILSSFCIFSPFEEFYKDVEECLLISAIYLKSISTSVLFL